MSSIYYIMFEPIYANPICCKSSKTTLNLGGTKDLGTSTREPTLPAQQTVGMIIGAKAHRARRWGLQSTMSSYWNLGPWATTTLHETQPFVAMIGYNSRSYNLQQRHPSCFWHGHTLDGLALQTSATLSSFYCGWLCEGLGRGNMTSSNAHALRLRIITEKSNDDTTNLTLLFRSSSNIKSSTLPNQHWN